MSFSGWDHPLCHMFCPACFTVTGDARRRPRSRRQFSLKATETGDCFIKYARFLRPKQGRGYLTWRGGRIRGVRNAIRHNNYTEITILNQSLIITLLCATRKQRRPKDLKRLKA